MTLDEAIEHAREVADNWKTQAHHFDGDSSEEANDLKTGCLECAKEHEQLAAWLEELKQYRGKVEDYIDGNLTMANFIFYLVDIHMNADEREDKT